MLLCNALAEDEVLDNLLKKQMLYFEKFRIGWIDNLEDLKLGNALESMNESIHIAVMIKEATKAIGRDLSQIYLQKNNGSCNFYLGWLWLPVRFKFSSWWRYCYESLVDKTDTPGTYSVG